MSINFDDLPISVRPKRLGNSDSPIYLLTGDTWAPSLCWAINKAQHNISMAMYSISARWSFRKYKDSNVFHSLLMAPKRGVNCSAILAAHKRTAATAKFNFFSGMEMQLNDWTIYDCPSSRLLHSKLIVIDDQVAFIGSHNIALSASVNNIDLSVAMFGEDVISEARKFIYSVMAISKRRLKG